MTPEEKYNQLKNAIEWGKKHEDQEFVDMMQRSLDRLVDQVSQLNHSNLGVYISEVI